MSSRNYPGTDGLTVEVARDGQVAASSPTWNVKVRIVPRSSAKKFSAAGKAAILNRLNTYYQNSGTAAALSRRGHWDVRVDSYSVEFHALAEDLDSAQGGYGILDDGTNGLLQDLQTAANFTAPGLPT